MTPTTSSPSLLLLNPAAQAGKATPVSDAKAAPDADLSGFELLLGNLQELQQKLSDGAKLALDPTENADQQADVNGNMLPVLGTILPPATPGDTAKTGPANNSKRDADDTNTDVAALVMAQPAVPGLVVEAARKADSDSAVQDASSVLVGADLTLPKTNPVSAKTNPQLKKTESGTTSNSAELVATDAALAATPALAGANSSDVKTDSARAAVDAALTGADATLSSPVTLARDNNRTDNRPSTLFPPLSSAASNVITNAAADTTTAATSLNSSSVSKDSDFDALIKHFEAPSATQSQSATQLAATTNIGDSMNAHQAARTYVDAASNSATVSVPVGSQGWSDAVADKVMWFSANKISSAEIHLNPPDLGPLQVRVSTQHDQASVVFTSQHAAVRDALDQALPRLRDMMGSQGMHLLDVSVGGQGAQQQQSFNRNDSANQGATFSSSFADDNAEASPTRVTTVNTARLLRSGFDAYA